MSQDVKDIKAIFSEALEKQTDDERSAYLSRICGNDAGLRDKIENLLKAHNDAGGFLEPPDMGTEATLDMPITEQPGTAIGRYKLLEQIGEGGMAVVYMAEQEEPIRRKVALKIIKLGMDTKGPGSDGPSEHCQSSGRRSHRYGSALFRDGSSSGGSYH